MISFEKMESSQGKVANVTEYFCIVRSGAINLCLVFNPSTNPVKGLLVPFL